MVRKFGQRLKRLLRDEDGNVTVEFVIWLPLMTGVLVGAFNLNYILLAQNDVWTVARETARKMATGEMTAVEAKDWAADRLHFKTYSYNITTSVGSDVSVQISSSNVEVSTIGVLWNKSNYHLSASISMRSEL